MIDLMWKGEWCCCVTQNPFSPWAGAPVSSEEPKTMAMHGGRPGASPSPQGQAMTSASLESSMTSLGPEADVGAGQLCVILA